ncbi:hypothetical protein J7J41_00085 [bacterium]|nr:hypothetical protein [bacterium]
MEEIREKEIDLRDYLKIILKRKWLILGIGLTVTIITFLFSFFSPKVYEISTSIEIGKSFGEPSLKKLIQEELNLLKNSIQEESNLLESPIQIKTKIEEGIYREIQEKFNLKVENPKNTNLILIKIESKNPEKDKKILEELNKIILEDHQKKLESQTSIFSKKEKIINAKISSLNREKKAIEERVKILEGISPQKRTLSEKFFLSESREKIERKEQEINNLQEKLLFLQKQIATLQPTEVIKEPTISKKPIKPNIILNTICALLLGLFGGIFFAFAKEWWNEEN